MRSLNKLLAGILFFTIVSCGGEKKASEETVATEEVAVEDIPKVTASAAISSASGSTLEGEALFSENEDGSVAFELKVISAVPGSHAIHLHANGDCSASDATSAGGHWNPAETEHGKRGESVMFHAGDIDNLMVGEDSTGSLVMNVKGWSIGGADSTNVIGKAIIIHAAADDFVSQPSGAAGPRVGCGVVIAND